MEEITLQMLALNHVENKLPPPPPPKEREEKQAPKPSESAAL